MSEKQSASTPTLLSVDRVWDRAAHNAFTDLARFRGRWYCTFREAKAHIRAAGKIRVIMSTDGRNWESTLLAAECGVDLRDPKLSVTPDGRLMLLAGGTYYKDDSPAGRQPRVLFTNDGRNWSKPVPILCEGDWLWRVTWHGSRSYGVTYRLKSSRTWNIYLVSSRDGIEYEEICRLPVTGKPNETTIRFTAEGRMVALVRREGGDKNGWIGSSTSPYRDWEFVTAGVRLGGPNFLVDEKNEMWAATRLIRKEKTHIVARTVLCRMHCDKIEPVLELPSDGDCSYPGLVMFRRLIWISYYSSHEGKSSIYLARVRIN